jgi:hypothetical protein
MRLSPRGVGRVFARTVHPLKMIMNAQTGPVVNDRLAIMQLVDKRLVPYTWGCPYNL